LPFTNTEIYLHQLLVELKPEVKKGQDSLIILKRDNSIFRMSLKKVLSGELADIKILADDRIFIESLPYRPETAILTGEVRQEKLIPISADQRQSLAEALYSGGGTIILGLSDTSQLFVIRELTKKTIVAYHLDASNPARLTLATKFELRPNDIIYVAPQFVTNYNRALSQIASAYALTTDTLAAN
jgi:protein involved in polysaccharide export with SLBB domain